MLLYLRGVSAQTVVRAATLRESLQIKFAVSLSLMLTSGHTVPVLTLDHQAPDRVAVVGLDLEKDPWPQ